MEPRNAVNVCPFKRTNSLLGSYSSPSHRCGVPPAVLATISQPREKFVRYGRTSLKCPGTTSQELEGASQTVCNALHPASEGDGARDVGPCSAAGARPPDGAVAAPLVVPEEVMPDNVCTEDSTKKVRRIPYDELVTPEVVGKLKHVTDCCPQKIAEFFLKVAESSAAALQEGSPTPYSSTFAPSSTSNVRSRVSLYPHHVSEALNALTELWEDRVDAPINVSNSIGRKRGLFGEVGKKELHHYVMSILNRVTGDSEKFSEVRNELLRLPIPEANDTELEKIVDIFILKAVRDQPFASQYADLIVALCKVPEGQRIMGDKAQSLEFRMRQRLLSRCQTEFLQLEKKNIEAAQCRKEERTSEGDDESFKCHRDRACGIVKFVGELFLRQIVTEKVILEIIFITTTGGSGRKGFRVPPEYTPSEAQMDEVIKLLDIVDAVFFVTPVGASLLSDFTKVMEHWSVSHPVSRIRFLLLTVVGRLQKLLSEGSCLQQRADGPSSAKQQNPDAVENPLVDAVGAARPSRLANDDSSALATGKLAAVATKTTMVSNQATAFNDNKIAPLRNSASSKASAPPSVANSSASGLPSSSTKLEATTENVASYMRNLSCDGRRLEELVADIVDRFSTPMDVVAVWTERCLTVTRTVKERTLFGPFLCLVAQYIDNEKCEEVRGVPMFVFQKAVRQELHEELDIFKYWTQMVCSDSTGAMLSEKLLNEGLEYLLENNHGAVRKYLHHVSMEVRKWRGDLRLSAERICLNYVRYRPLQVLHGYCVHNKNSSVLSWLENNDARAYSAEINVFCSLVTGKPPKNQLFKDLRDDVCVSSPLTPAEVLSAILYAELHMRVSVLNKNVDLLMFVIDHKERSVRELLLVCELYHLLKYMSQNKEPSMCAGQRVMTLLLADEVVSSKTREEVHKYLDAYDEKSHYFIGVLPRHTQCSDTGCSVIKNIKNHDDTVNHHHSV
ncbi:MIF4G domain [Trypanosoma vivax]|uniref:MIF4G domain-containing protein n=1 Tax=Trypanosoma vivax (strain Y486) TaxID=1055687 RepID=G0U272_TRYVY|nr:hypothetical protein TRVL_08641 [Trypanosoma vivax]KAH8611785.1 MIF4G domain [Trypanosoma vivax]CCC50375.1 conserved hypothetical protein [Trypanosoma vivax Y486]